MSKANGLAYVGDATCEESLDDQIPPFTVELEAAHCALVVRYVLMEA